jgi:pilus assembly protein CpaB
LKRSNRLILLIGFFLAAVAFVGVIYALGNNTPGTTNKEDKTTNVVAAVDIALGTVLTDEMLTTQDIPRIDKVAGTPSFKSEVIGQTVTTDIKAGQQIVAADFSTVTVNPNIGRLLDTGERAMAVMVDQVSGVGTLVKPGDHVDVVIGIAGADKFPVVTTDPVTKQPTVVPGINATSVKAIIQNLKVVGTLLPPPPTDQTNTGGTEGTTGTGTGTAPSLNGQTQIVLLAVNDKQAEVLRFGQIDGTITIILRSPNDDLLPADTTDGVTLRQLVDKWAVIPPEVVETVLPKK